MTKKALCVGINQYRVKPLRGCVNDANAWAKLLTERFDYPTANIRVVTDADATKVAMLAALEALLAGASSGDVFVFTNSSHGTQIAVRADADESVAEAICPVDYESGFLVDDELRELFSSLRPDVSLAVIADSCHSGTVTRAPDGTSYGDNYYERARWLDSDFLPAGTRPTAAGLGAQRDPYPETQMREILLAGCRDTESSYDARLGTDFHGAMTHHAIATIEAANYQLTYQQLAAQLGERFARSQFASKQHPQLEGSAANIARQIFT